MAVYLNVQTYMEMQFIGQKQSLTVVFTFWTLSGKLSCDFFK